MDNFDYRKFVYSQSLTKDEDTKQTLNENAPGYDTRKFGEALPTLESVKAAHEAKQLKEEEEELMPKKISDEGFTIVYQVDDMTDYKAYDELLSDKEQDLASGYGTFIFDSNTPADEIEDFLMPEDAEEGNDKLRRYGLSKYWKY